MTEKRNIRVEAARIARGNVLDVTEVNVNDIDALFIPVVLGLLFCSFAFEGANASIEQDIKSFIQAVHQANKPIGAVCIAPAVLALSLGKGTLTIGSDAGTAEALENWAPPTKSVLSQRWWSILTTNWSLHQRTWKMLRFTKSLKVLKKLSKRFLNSAEDTQQLVYRLEVSNLPVVGTVIVQMQMNC